MSIYESEPPLIINLDDKEIANLLKAYKEVFRQIEDWEFQTRVGVSAQQIEVILHKIGLGPL